MWTKFCTEVTGSFAYVLGTLTLATVYYIRITVALEGIKFGSQLDSQVRSSIQGSEGRCADLKLDLETNSLCRFTN